MANVISVLTFKSVETILRNGGTQSWSLDPDRARACKYVVICRNAKTRDAQGPEPHGSAFMVGKVNGVVPSTESDGRWLITISKYALVEWLDQWQGRNPVAYWDTSDYGDISDFESLDFVPMPILRVEAASEKLSLTLPPALDAWIKERVASGDFIDASDYLRDLVRRDQARSSRLSDWIEDASAND